MLNISDTAKKLILGTVCVAVALSIIGSFFVTAKLEFFFGAFTLIAVNVVKIVLMERAITRSADMDVKGATLYTRAQYTMRYFMTLIVMVLIATMSVSALYGAIVAMLGMPVASYAMRFIMRKEIENNINT